MLIPLAARGDEPSAAVVELRAVRPEAQGEALIALFEGTAWPHPAAALADWKRSAAGGEERSLGKATEAIIAAMNPMMVRELATFDGTRFFLDLDPAPEAPPRWAALVPADDGTISALATALVLTDGLRMDPEGPFQVDRIGPPGSLLIASIDRGGPAILASDRRALATAIARRDRLDDAGAPGIDSGWIVRANPAGMLGSGSGLARRIGAAAMGLGYPRIEARARLVGESFEVDVEGPALPGGGGVAWGAIDPRWLDLIPADRASAAVSSAVGEGDDPWAGLLEVADRIERADPTRADVLPIRQRLAALGLARGVRPEVDLWPVLSGVTAWVAFDGSGGLDSGVIALHARDDAGADRIARKVVGRLLGEGGNPPAAIPTEMLGEGTRRIRTVRLGSTVLVGFGSGALDDSRDAMAHPDRSAGPILREGWEGGPALAPARVAGVWPARLPWFGAEIRDALEAAPPIVWRGWSDERTTRDVLRWEGLRGPVRSFLARLPAEVSPRLDGPTCAPEAGQ